MKPRPELEPLPLPERARRGHCGGCCLYDLLHHPLLRASARGGSGGVRGLRLPLWRSGCAAPRMRRSMQNRNPPGSGGVRVLPPASASVAIRLHRPPDHAAIRGAAGRGVLPPASIISSNPPLPRASARGDPVGWELLPPASTSVAIRLPRRRPAPRAEKRSKNAEKRSKKCRETAKTPVCVIRPLSRGGPAARALQQRAAICACAACAA